MPLYNWMPSCSDGAKQSKICAKRCVINVINMENILFKCECASRTGSYKYSLRGNTFFPIRSRNLAVAASFTVLFQVNYPIWQPPMCLKTIVESLPTMKKRIDCNLFFNVEAYPVLAHFVQVFGYLNFIKCAVVRCDSFLNSFESGLSFEVA